MKRLICIAAFTAAVFSGCRSYEPKPVDWESEALSGVLLSCGSVAAVMQFFVLLLIIVPFWTNFLIRIYAWKVFLHPNGFFKELSLATNQGFSLIPLIASDIALNPTKRIPKPMTTSATFFTLSFLQNIFAHTPANKIAGAYSDKLMDTN